MRSCVTSTNRKWDAEILVVDDGSRDDTPEIVREYARLHPQVLLIQNPGNRGKGFSVRNGICMPVAIFACSPTPTCRPPISEARPLFEALRQGADVAIGSRWLRAELQNRTPATLSAAFRTYLQPASAPTTEFQTDRNPSARARTILRSSPNVDFLQKE